jgi:hypothetical protein
LTLRALGGISAISSHFAAIPSPFDNVKTGDADVNDALELVVQRRDKY